MKYKNANCAVRRSDRHYNSHLTKYRTIIPSVFRLVWRDTRGHTMPWMQEKSHRILRNAFNGSRSSRRTWSHESRLEVAWRKHKHVKLTKFYWAIVLTLFYLFYRSFFNRPNDDTQVLYDLLVHSSLRTQLYITYLSYFYQSRPRCSAVRKKQSNADRVSFGVVSGLQWRYIIGRRSRKNKETRDGWPMLAVW